MSKLHAAGNQLMIYSVSDEVFEKIKVTKAYEIFGEQYIFPSSPIFGASLEEDWQAAEKRAEL